MRTGRFVTYCLVVFGAVGLLTGGLTGCSDNSSVEQSEDAPLPSVVVTTVKKVSVNPSRSFVGRIEAVEDVQVKARVSGYLLAMDFTEGQSVNAGDLLFEIDPKPYEVEVARLKAEVKRQQAALTNAERNYERGKGLVDDGYISATDMDELESRRDQANASLISSRAALENAELDLSYTNIKAPISGRIGRKTVSIGDLISPESGALVTLVSMDPMYVTFDLAEKVIANATIKYTSGQVDYDRLPVPNLILPNKKPYSHTGKFDFIDNRVDRATGTVKVRAVFPNPDGLLLPGQYVAVVVQASSSQESILVPQAAVSEDQQGKFVMVVDAENKVQQRRVEMGERIDINWVVDSGLEPEEKVIVEGLQKVRVGQEVEPVEQTVKAFEETKQG